MFNIDKFDVNSFKPQSPFEGWIYAKIGSVEKTLSNHQSYHIKLEIALVIFGLSLLGSLVYIVLT